MIYFAYGSNMLSARLRERVPSARVVGPGWVTGFELRFHKAGADASGKCNIHESGSPGHVVHGAVFEMDHADQDRLDRCEGPGYAARTLRISMKRGASLRAYSYVATRIDESLLPFEWYHALVLAGAREHALPAEYIENIAAVKFIEDPDGDRARRHLRIIG